MNSFSQLNRGCILAVWMVFAWPALLTCSPLSCGSVRNLLCSGLAQVFFHAPLSSPPADDWIDSQIKRGGCRVSKAQSRQVSMSREYSPNDWRTVVHFPGYQSSCGYSIKSSLSSWNSWDISRSFEQAQAVYIGENEQLVWPWPQMKIAKNPRSRSWRSWDAWRLFLEWDG